MRTLSSHTLIKRASQGAIALLSTLALLLVLIVPALASSVNIYDNAGVLNQSQIKNAASSLAYPLNIYTSNYNGSSSQFDQVARGKVNGSNNIVFAINTRGHVYADGGSSVPLTSSQYTSASQSFVNEYRNSHNFTSGTLAFIQSISNALSSSNGGFLGGATRSAGGIGSSVLCCIGVLVILGLLFFVISRRRRGGGGGGGFGGFGGFGRRPVQPNYDPNYNQPYQGNYPPNYGPGYPPNQGGGMNPLAAGGLGAAAGGFLGYELGKQQGEREYRDDQGNNGGGFGGGDNNGGGGGADFDPGNGGGGGGGGADFGGGGGGGDFGGGGGGGGGDF